MKPAEVLKWLEKARQIIEVLPEDTGILTVQIDGLDCREWWEKLDCIHLHTPFERLVEEKAIDPNGWTTIDDPGREFLEDSILTGGFRLFHLRQRGNTAPGVISTGDGKAGQSPNKDKPIIEAGKEEVKP